MKEAVMTPDDRRELLELLDRSRDQLLELVSGLDDDTWRQRPDESRWSVGEVVEHVVKTEKIVLRATRESLNATPDPSWRTKTEGSLRRAATLLANRRRTAQAPAYLTPANEVGAQDGIAAFKEARGRSRGFAEATEEPLKAYLRPHPFPVFGVLNGYQWLCFIAHHQMRHDRQVEEVLAQLQEEGAR